MGEIGFVIGYFQKTKKKTNEKGVCVFCLFVLFVCSYRLFRLFLDWKRVWCLFLGGRGEEEGGLLGGR